jgi:sigma-B regulation protein RsbU (phosphoserine phosphatase)
LVKTPVWRRYRNYLFLIPLFAIALFYQLTYTAVAIHVTAHPMSTPSRPFGTNEQTVAGVDRDMEHAGLHNGDKIMMIDGRPFMGDRVLMEETMKMSPHQMLHVMVMPKGGRTARTLDLHPRFWDTKPADAWRWGMVGVLLAMMLFCLSLGVYVAAVLPHDLRAITVFGLMSATSPLISVASWYTFPHPLWLFADLMHAYAVGSWPIWLLLFPLYFPHRFAWDTRRPHLKWIVLVPLFAWTLVEMAGNISRFWHFGALAVLADKLYNPVIASAVFALAPLFFFGAIIAKIRHGKDSDSCRRLRILLAGSLLGLAPLVGLVLYETVNSARNFNKTPESAVIAVCLLFCIFPATLGYVVIAERAMRLRVVLRQGVRYALAKGGIRVVIAALAIAVYWSLSSSVTTLQLSTPAKIAIIVVCVIVFGSILRNARRHIMLWLDRRFFRESYDAELLLQELGETVQSILDEHELLDTVAKRISATLHVPQVAVLLNGGGFYRPVYCLGFNLMREPVLPENCRTVDVIQAAKDPPPIYFERNDNWVHSTTGDEIAALRDIHAQILLPVGRKQQTLGLLSLGPKKSQEPFTSSDIQLLRTVAVQTGLALQNSRLASDVAREMSEREKLRREIEIAREVQQRLFPQSLPPVAGLDYFGACRPALEVGGDYYDFLPLANGDLGIAIGDVSGKGIAAALLMASLQASLRGQAMMNQGDLARLMSNVNQLVFDATDVNRYATFFYGQFNLASSVFTYVNAGHNPPIVCRFAAGKHHVIRLDTGGPVIGLLPGAPYQQGTIAMQAGDVFVGFTDGISEAMNGDDEEWGEARFIPAIAKYESYTAADMIPALMTEADRFVDGAPQHDDMTLIVMRMVATA